MARPEKVAAVEEIRSRLESCNAAVLTEYRGLRVGDLAAVRAALRGLSTDYRVLKNTLARRAALEVGLPGLVRLLTGPTAIAFVRGDAAAAAKALRDYSRANPILVLKGGVIGTRVLGAGEVAALAELPPREVLLARMAGGLAAPMARAAGLFAALPRNMAYGIKALIEARTPAVPAAVATSAVEG